MEIDSELAGLMLLAWPALERVLPQGRQRDLWERLKYRLRLALVRPLTPELLRTLRTHPTWAALYLQNPRRFHPALSGFLDRRWSRAERFRAVVRDLEVAAERFGPALAARIADGQGPDLMRFDDGGVVRLGLNRINPQEGHWALELLDPRGARLFNLAFGFLDGATLLVSSVQGGEGGAVSTREAIHALTKRCHGLRPAPLLLATLQCLAAHWGVRHLVGIDPSAHIKGRWNQRKRLRFGYRELWTESGGRCVGGAYWQLPLAPRERSRDEIPSNKRAQYRRRYALMAELRSAVGAALGTVER